MNDEIHCSIPPSFRFILPVRVQRVGGGGTGAVLVPSQTKHSQVPLCNCARHLSKRQPVPVQPTSAVSACPSHFPQKSGASHCFVLLGSLRSPQSTNWQSCRSRSCVSLYPHARRLSDSWRVLCLLSLPLIGSRIAFTSLWCHHLSQALANFPNSRIAILSLLSLPSY
jgi:hypothetical protein